MNTDDRDADDTGLPFDLTLRQAAQRYDVTARTLAQHIRWGQLPGYKTRGATGREWRVTEEALQAAGHRPRCEARAQDGPEDADVSGVRRELAAAERAANAERRRADDLDRRLGQAMLQLGQLRAALAEASGRPHQPSEPALDAATASWLVQAVRSTVVDQRRGSPHVDQPLGPHSD